MEKKGWSLIILTILIVSSTEIILKQLGTSFPVGFQLNFWRFFLGGIFLICLSTFTEKKSVLSLKNLWILSLHAFLFIVFSMSVYQLAINTMLASLVAIIFSTNPLITQFIEVIYYKKKSPYPTLLAILFAVFALFIIIQQYSNISITSVFLALTSALLFSCYSFLSAKYTKKQNIPTIKYTGYVFIIGALELLLFSFLAKQMLYFFHGSDSTLFGYLNFSLFKNITPQNFPIILYLSIVVTAGGFVLYFICKRDFNTLSPIVFLAKPAVSSIFSVFFLGEVLSFYSVLGIILLLLSSIIAMGRK